MIQDPVLNFMNSVAPKVGPVNAFNLLRDAQMEAFKQLFLQLGVTKERIDEAMNASLTKTAQNISKMPVPSPIQ